MAEDTFYSGTQEPDENSIVIIRGPAGGRVFLKAKGDRLLVVIEGEPQGRHLIEAFREGLGSGALRANMRTLADLTRFTGPIDWGAIYTVRKLAPWGEDGTGGSRIAYVVRNNMFGVLIKIAEALFFNSSHHAFDNYQSAVAWLESFPAPETE